MCLKIHMYIAFILILEKCNPCIAGRQQRRAIILSNIGNVRYFLDARESTDPRPLFTVSYKCHASLLKFRIPRVPSEYPVLFPYETVLEQSAINAVLTRYQYTVLLIVSAFWNKTLNKTLLNRSLCKRILVFC